MTEPLQAVALDFNAEDVGNPPFSGSADFFFDLQWGHTAVGVLDGGFDLDHPDLALIIGANGGSMHPAQVESLRRAGDSG